MILLGLWFGFVHGITYLDEKRGAFYHWAIGSNIKQTRLDQVLKTVSIGQDNIASSDLKAGWWSGFQFDAKRN